MAREVDLATATFTKKLRRKTITDGRAVGAVNTSNSAKRFPYVFVPEAAEKLQISESTVRRLIKKCKLKGELFEQQRKTHSLPSPSKYHISGESLKEFLEATVAEH